MSRGLRRSRSRFAERLHDDARKRRLRVVSDKKTDGPTAGTRSGSQANFVIIQDLAKPDGADGATEVKCATVGAQFQGLPRTKNSLACMLCPVASLMDLQLNESSYGNEISPGIDLGRGGLGVPHC